MVTDGVDQHVEPVKPVSRARVWVAAVLIATIPNVLVQLPPFGPPVKALTMLIAPLFAGLVAGKSGTRPVFRGATACALGTLAVLFVVGAISGEFPTAGRDLVPSAFVVAYSTAVGAFGAWIASRGR